MDEKLIADQKPETTYKVGYGKPPLEARFKPGNPGGPGAPRKRPITEEYDEVVRELLPEKERRALGLPPGTTWGRAIALSRARHALLKTGVADAKEMREAIEGKSTQRIELTAHREDRTPEFVVVYATPIPGLKEESKDIIDMVPTDGSGNE